MEIKIEINKTIKSLIDLKKEGLLKVNHEYQRAPVWKEAQEQMFIDSVFRGYSIPAFYFHHKKATVDGFSTDALDIIDGQQRTNALYKYHEGSYALLDPENDSKFKFPNFVKGHECPWAGKRFQDLDEDLKSQFLQQKVVIYFITTQDENEIRDLFIRLQGGIPLSPQEKRDSWPGNFTDYVLNLGGKHGVDKYPGKDFFNRIATPSGGESNKRKLAAQLAMLYFNRKRSDIRSFCDIKSVNIDDFYHQNIDFDPFSKETKRFEKILSKLENIFQDSRVLKGKGHYTISLILLIDSLLDNHVHGWEEKLHEALVTFHKKCLAAKKAVKENNPTKEHEEYYNSYVRWATTQSDIADTIRKRYSFFSEKILPLIDPKQKDPKRNFAGLEKEIIYYRDRQKCQVCMMEGMSSIISGVHWDQAEIHHVKPHNEG